MARKARIVTDSTARFEDPAVIEDYEIVVMPVELRFGAESLRDGIDISAEETLHRLRRNGERLTVHPPTQEEFESVFHKLSKSTDQICVALHSQAMTNAISRAQVARAGLLGRCEIAVIDSQTTSLGLGYLVEEVARAAADGATLDEVLRVSRSAIPRIYSVYYVESLDAIQQAGLIGETQAILGRMLNIKPLLTIEDGKLIVMEKVRTHSQAIDKIVEFVGEFTHLQRAGILQSALRVTERTRMLQDRLALALARVNYPIALNDPLLSSMMGPDVMGMAVLEGEDGDDLDMDDF